MFDRDYIFYGKYATYAKYLCKDKGTEMDDRANVFNRVVDVLLVAPLIGIIKNRYVSEPDNTDRDKSTVSLSTLNGESLNLKQVYRMVMLANTNDDLSDETKVDQAFRFDDVLDEDNPNMKIFNGYVRGGLEYLYEYFERDTTFSKKQRKINQVEEIKNLVDDLSLDNPNTYSID